jgi:hypothetical protein
MGRSTWRTVWSWTATVGDLVAADGEVLARCSRCRTERPVDLQRLIADKGPLYTLWNRTAACRSPGCNDEVTFLARRRGTCTWPVTMTGADPGRVAFLDAEWRASRISRETGGTLAMALAAGMLGLLYRAGAMDDAARQQAIESALSMVPAEQREDARWLVEYLVSRGQDRPGWR